MIAPQEWIVPQKLSTARVLSASCTSTNSHVRRDELYGLYAGAHNINGPFIEQDIVIEVVNNAGETQKRSRGSKEDRECPQPPRIMRGEEFYYFGQQWRIENKSLGITTYVHILLNWFSL